MNINVIKPILAAGMKKVKVKNPVWFVVIAASLYGYTFLLDTGATLDWMLGLVGEDINSVPVGLMKIIDGSKYVAGAFLGIMGGHTTEILSQAKKNV